MLGLVTGPAREGATSARRENIDPINLVQSIMNEFPTIGIDEICRRVDAVLVLAANLAPAGAGRARGSCREPNAVQPARCAGKVSVASPSSSIKCSDAVRRFPAMPLIALAARTLSLTRVSVSAFERGITSVIRERQHFNKQHGRPRHNQAEALPKISIALRQSVFNSTKSITSKVKLKVAPARKTNRRRGLDGYRRIDLKRNLALVSGDCASA